MLFKVTDIDWDIETDDDDKPECCSCHHFNDLPETLIVEIDDRYNINPPFNVPLSNEQEYEHIIEEILNHMSDTHAWCVNNCMITRLQ